MYTDQPTNTLQLDPDNDNLVRNSCICRHSSTSNLQPIEMTFSTCFQDLKTWPERIEWLHELEGIRQQYAEYNISFVSEVIVPTDLLSYMHNAMVTSQGQVRKSSESATQAHMHTQVLLVTTVVVFLFTATTLQVSNMSLFMCTCTLFMIINATVCGTLLMWNCDVDPITMVASNTTTKRTQQFTGDCSYVCRLLRRLYRAHITLSRQVQPRRRRRLAPTSRAYT